MGSSYRDLVAWQKGIQLVLLIYRLTVTFPKDELYGLVSQLRRAAVSVPSNIAEGQGRKSSKEFRHFLHNAIGSLMEIETQVTIAQLLGYLTKAQGDDLLNRTNELGRICNGLVNSLPAESYASNTVASLAIGGLKRKRVTNDAVTEWFVTGDRRLVTGDC